MQYATGLFSSVDLSVRKDKRIKTNYMKIKVTHKYFRFARLLNASGGTLASLFLSRYLWEKTIRVSIKDASL